MRYLDPAKTPSCSLHWKDQTRHVGVFSIISCTTFIFFEAMKVSNLNKEKVPTTLRGFWTKAQVFEINIIIFTKIFLILTLSRKINNTSSSERLFRHDYELLSLPGFRFLFLPLHPPKNPTWQLALTGHSNHSWSEGNVGELTRSNFQKKYLSPYYTADETLRWHQCKHC